jgi:hypothetical protein
VSFAKFLFLPSWFAKLLEANFSCFAKIIWMPSWFAKLLELLYVPPFGGIPTSPSYYGGPQMQAWGGGAPVPPPNYVVPNVTFAEPSAQYPQPQQSMAIIGGYVARNMQNVAAIQSNTAQLGEGNANTVYELGRLHLVQPDQFV